MSHTFYIQNASRRSAQAFPITLAPGAKFADARHDFAAMLGTPSEQIIRLTTAEGHIILPGQEVPPGTLLLEVERRAFDKLTGAGTFAPLEGVWSTRTFMSTILPAIVVFLMFIGFVLLLAGLASASDQCRTDEVDAEYLSAMFGWGTNTVSNYAGVSDVTHKRFGCGMGVSLFWWIIVAELLLVIIPAVILLFWAGSFNADTKGSWAYIITCTLNILTALLCYEAFVVVPGAWYGQHRDVASGKAQATIKCLAAGVIIILFANFMWIFCQAFGKMIPDVFQCCSCFNSMSNRRDNNYQPSQTTGVVSTNSPLSTPTKAPGNVVVTTA